jgi:hypothetical protein
MIHALRVQWNLFRLPEFNDAFSMGFVPAGVVILPRSDGFFRVIREKSTGNVRD